MKKLLSLGVALCTTLSFMPVTNVLAMSGQDTQPDTTFDISNTPGTYYKIVLKEKSLLSFHLEENQKTNAEYPYPMLALNNAKGKYVAGFGEEGMDGVMNKGTYYLHYFAYGNDATTEQQNPASGKLTYHIAQFSQAKTISYKKENNGKAGSYYPVLYKAKVKGVQKIKLNTNSHTTSEWLDGFPLGKKKDKNYTQTDIELENCTSYYAISSTAQNLAYSFKATRKVYYKNFPLSFADRKKMNKIKLNKKYYGHYQTDGEISTYKFTLKNAKTVKVMSAAFKSKKRLFAYYIFNDPKYRSDICFTKSFKFHLKPGTYYLRCYALNKSNIDVMLHYDFMIKG